MVPISRSTKVHAWIFWSVSHGVLRVHARNFWPFESACTEFLTFTIFQYPSSVHYTEYSDISTGFSDIHDFFNIHQACMHGISDLSTEYSDIALLLPLSPNIEKKGLSTDFCLLRHFTPHFRPFRHSKIGFFFYWLSIHWRAMKSCKHVVLLQKIRFNWLW